MSKTENNETEKLLISESKDKAEYLDARSLRGTLLLIGSASVINFLCVGFSFSLGIFYPEFTRVFDSDRSYTALIQSVHSCFLVGGSILWNPFVVRFGPGKCIIGGACLSFVGIFLSYFSANVWMVIVCIGIISAIGGCMVTIGPFLIINNSMDRWKHASLSILPVGTSLGQFVFAYLVEYLIEEYSWNGALVVMSGILANMLPCALIIYFIEKDYCKAHTTRNSNKLFDKEVFKEWRFYLLIINGFLTSFSCFVESKFLVDLMMLEGFARATGSQFVSFIGLSNFAGRVLGSMQKIVSKRGNILIQLSVLIFINGISHVVILFYRTYNGLLIGAILNGLSYGICVAQMPVMMLEIFSSQLYGPAVAFFNILAGLGTFVGGYFGGFIQDTTGSYDLLLQLATSFSVLISIFYCITGVSVLKHRRGVKLSYTDL